MNIGIYQSASALSALERWQDSVSQNISSSQTSGYRKRTVNFTGQNAGELHTSRGSHGGGDALPVTFPKVSTGISFTSGENQQTRRDLDAAIQGDGFFEVQLDDGSKVYTRSGEFQLRADRTLVTSGGHEVMGDGGTPITLIAGGGPVTISPDGSVLQGETAVGKLAVQKFENNAELVPIAGGYFAAPNGVQPQRVEQPQVLQGYREGSNVTPLREMVDLILISRAYEANQKIIRTVDDQMEKTLNALG